MRPPPSSRPPISQSSAQFLCLTESPQVFTNRTQSNTVSPFLRLPTEIRLRIYSLLVLPQRNTELSPCGDRVSSSVQDKYDYDRRQHGFNRFAAADLSRPVLLIRTIEPHNHAARSNANARPMRRTTYTVLNDRFRARTMVTTYHCLNVPRLEQNLGILRVNRQIHFEAAEMLYSGYTFDFDTHVEAIIPFLADLTPFARACVRSLRVVKRALAYEKEFDRAEWTAAMRYLTASGSGLSLRRLSLGVVAGRPGPNGWERIARYTAHDFALLKELEGMEWMQYLLEFRGLEELNVHAVVEHCPPGHTSMAMAGFIRFSASVEDGFRAFLQQQLLMPAADAPRMIAVAAA